MQGAIIWDETSATRKGTEGSCERSSSTNLSAPTTKSTRMSHGNVRIPHLSFRLCKET